MLFAFLTVPGKIIYFSRNNGVFPLHMPVKLIFIKSLGHLPVAEWHSVERIGVMPNTE